MISSMQNNISFKSNPLINTTSFIEERVLLNKALLDGAQDISTVCLTNNKVERIERIRRASLAWSLAFLTPFITLPLTNRLAMKYIAKLSPGFFSKENNLIKLSNKYLHNANATQKGIEELSKKNDIGAFSHNKNCDYEKIRRKIIDAKTAVLAFDCLFTAGSAGSIGFINRYLTRKKNGKDGFSAEFNMADSAYIEARAKKYKESEKLRNNIFIGALSLLTASPLLIRKGLNSTGKFANFIKRHADKFDYNDGIFMKRLPFLLMTIVCCAGILCSSRNNTELKDNAIRLSVSNSAFFGGDIIIGSALAAISDKLFKTELLDKNCKKSFINKIIPPIKHIKDLQGKNKSIAAGLFWANMISLFAVIGIGVPKLVNRMIRKDVDKNVSTNYKENFSNNNFINSDIFKTFKLINSQT